MAVTVGLGALAGDRPSAVAPANLIDGPFARLLAESTDLGPTRDQQVQITAALNRASEPVRLRGWAGAHGLSVRWRAGDTWAIVEGRPQAVADAFGVAVHDYRTLRGPDAGRVFYASPQQPEIPGPASAEIAGLGRILSYTPYRERLPPTLPLDVPDGGLLPNQLLSAYNATSLTESGYTGEGSTVVVCLNSLRLLFGKNK